MKVTNSAGHFCSVKFGTVLRKVSLTLKVEEKLSKEAKRQHEQLVIKILLCHLFGLQDF